MTGRIVAFGEILLRYSPPGREQLFQTPRLETWVGGAEANVASALSGLGHAVAMVGAVPDNALGDAAVRAMRGAGVDVRHLIRAPGRMGVYYVTPGAGRRATEVVYDRAGSSFATAAADLWDWPAILDGAGLLHLSGITPALGANGVRHATAAVEAAVRAGVPVSFDGNFRESLWALWDGRPGETLRALVRHATYLFGNHRDIALMLGREFPDEPDRARIAAEAAFAAFPALTLAASTTRRLVSVDEHHIAARIDTRDDSHETDTVAVTGIVDRIGTGDAFAAGVLHGLGGDGASLRQAAHDGLAATVLKHSMAGDAAPLRASDLAHFHGGGIDVRR